MEEEVGIRDDFNESEDKNPKEEIFTKIVRAGKRTYFFDVKATRKDDYYLTITESKKRLGKEGRIFYEKHKIFLYKEDFDKFAGGLNDAVNFIDSGKDYSRQAIPEVESQAVELTTEITNGEFTNIEFDDLGKK